MNLRPLNGNILIEVKKQKEVSSSGIYMPTATEKLEEAVVLAIADDVTNITIGDTILFKDYSTDTISIDGKDMCFIKETEVLGILQ